MTTIVLDAGVVISALDSSDIHHQACVAALTGLARDQLVVPASVLADVLVRPYARGAFAVRRVEHFLADLGARIQPLDALGAHAAARLQASHPGLRLPDAFAVGTASVLKGAVLTTHTRWPHDLGVTVRIISG